jgi:hypothetical protein
MVSPRENGLLFLPMRNLHVLSEKIGNAHHKAKPKQCHDAMVSISYLKAYTIQGPQRVGLDTVRC